jgi:hypothetical protein
VGGELDFFDENDGETTGNDVRWSEKAGTPVARRSRAASRARRECRLRSPPRTLPPMPTEEAACRGRIPTAVTAPAHR